MSMEFFMAFFAGGEAENSDTMSDETEQSWYHRSCISSKTVSA